MMEAPGRRGLIFVPRTYWCVPCASRIQFSSNLHLTFWSSVSTGSAQHIPSSHHLHALCCWPLIRHASAPVGVVLDSPGMKTTPHCRLSTTKIFSPTQLSSSADPVLRPKRPSPSSPTSSFSRWTTHSTPLETRRRSQPHVADSTSCSTRASTSCAGTAGRPWPSPQWTPLHTAICHGDESTAILLLDFGASHTLSYHRDAVYPVEAPGEDDVFTAPDAARTRGFGGVVAHITEHPRPS